MIKILLVDDQALLCEVLQTRLEVEEDFEVIGRAYDGENAIEQVKKFRPDVVLLDVEMPKMDGFTASKIIKQNYPATKIIILTGHRDESYFQKALDAGAASYLPKDTTAEDLKNTIRSVCQHSNENVNIQVWAKFQEKINEIETTIEAKWLTIEEDVTNIKDDFQKSIQTIVNAEANVTQSFKKLENRLETRWNGLQSDVVNLEDQIRAIMNDIDQAEHEYQKHLSNLQSLKMDLENSLTQLNEAGFNPDNFKKIDRLQEQLNSYKSYVHQIYREEKQMKKFSSISLLSSILAVVISFGVLFLYITSR
jgi:DNA-binding NarL/FixJ family response regulator